MRVLIIDDNAHSRELIKIMLQHLGHAVFEAESGKEGLKVATKQHPEFALVDLSMPDVDGFETIAALRALSVGQIPIIAISNFPETMWGEKAEQAGCNAYLRKPFGSPELSQLITRFSL